MALTDFTVKNGFSVDNQEDAISSTSGGSFTTKGGAAIAKKLFVGSDVDIGGNLHLAAGTTTVAPLTLTSGTNLTTPINGGIEYDGTRLYFTPNTAIRKTIALTDDVHYIGTTSIALNRSSANLALTGISSLSLSGATSGNIILKSADIAGTNTITLPSTTGNIVTTGDTGTVTSTMIANETIVNNDINNSAGIEVTKLSASTISGVTLGNNLYGLSVGTGLTYSVGSTYDGSADATISLNQQAINTIIANTTFVVNNIYIGTTLMSVERASANQSFTGISSIEFPGSTSGNITLEATAIAGTNTIKLPATTGTIVTTGDTGTITSTMIANGTIANDDLAGSISDSKLLTISTANKVSNSATSATSTNTSSTIVARDSSGNFSAGTITATLSGNASTSTTAERLTSATTIQGVSFDGSSAITVVTAGTGVAVSGTAVSIGQAVSTTSNVTFNDVTISGNLTMNGGSSIINSVNTTYADSIIELHYTNGGTLTSNDGKDIGIRMHYYNNSDKNAALLLANDTQNLEFYVDGTESNGVFTGTYGVFKGFQFKSTATTGTAPFIVSSTTRVTNLNAATAGNADSVTNGVYTTDTGTVTSTMIANDTILNADINSNAAIAYSKLNLSTSIVNADVSTTAAIAYSKLNLSTSIVNADISTSAAIAVSKLASSTISGVTLGNNLFSLSAGTGLTYSVGSAFNGSAASTLALADNYGDTKNPYASKTQKYFLAAPNNIDGSPVFRSILSSDIPTLNQNTTGSAATLTTPRAIYGNNFDGSTALTQVIASTYGGTGNGFTKFTGPTTAERIFTLPDLSATLLYSGGALGTPSGGTLTNCTFPTLNQNTTGSAGSVTSSLTFNNGGSGDASGSTYNGSAAKTISYNSIGAAASNQTHYIGTTSVAINRSSANMTLSGITSIDGGTSTSQTLTIQSTTGAGDSDSIVFKTGLVGATAMTINTYGNVGVGTINPIGKFQVRPSTDINIFGTLNGSAFQWTTANDAYTSYIDIIHESLSHRWSTNNVEKLRLDTSGNLIVGSGEAGATPSGGTIRAPNATGTNIAGTNLTITSGNGTGTGGSGAIIFKTASTGSTGATVNTMTERVRIDASGNILPGTTTTYNIGSATYKWSNVYATTFNGNATSANYADLAENYEADKKYEPGTVVEFGGNFEITEAIPNSRRVAGIISTNPAYLMNAEATGHFILPVGLTGRVPCKVQGTIRKGDMMVSAGNGRAKADEDPKLGSVIGKALEDFDGEIGIIEVVVGRM